MDLFFLARRFVAGVDIPSAIGVVRGLNQKGLQATLDFLGENVRDREQAEKAVAAYAALLEQIAAAGIDSDISVKLTQLGLDISESFCEENMRRLLARAAEYRNFVWIDMEGSAYTQRTVDLFVRLFRTHPHVGVALQAYLYRSEHDARVLAEIGARVRLCKGAYREPRTIAYRRMRDIRRNFLRLAEILFERGSAPAIATHDEQLIEAIRRMTAERGIAPERFEFQMLYGIRPRLAERLAHQGYRVRIYVPFGTHWFPYFFRRLRERKENIWFVLKNLLEWPRA
jgi:proline dehydrogenase